MNPPEVSKVSKGVKRGFDSRGVKSVTPFRGTLTPDTCSDSGKVSECFDTEAHTIETDLSGDDFIALCGNMAWRLLWQERRGVAGWRVKAVRVTPEQPEAVAVRYPMADP